MPSLTEMILSDGPEEPTAPKTPDSSPTGAPPTAQSVKQPPKASQGDLFAMGQERATVAKAPGWCELYADADEIWKALCAQNPGDLVPPAAKERLTAAITHDNAQKFKAVLERLGYLAWLVCQVRHANDLMAKGGLPDGVAAEDVVRLVRGLRPGVFGDDERRAKWRAAAEALDRVLQAGGS